MLTVAQLREDIAYTLENFREHASLAKEVDLVALQPVDVERMKQLQLRTTLRRMAEPLAIAGAIPLYCFSLSKGGRRISQPDAGSFRHDYLVLDSLLEGCSLTPSEVSSVFTRALRVTGRDAKLLIEGGYRSILLSMCRQRAEAATKIAPKLAVAKADCARLEGEIAQLQLKLAATQDASDGLASQLGDGDLSEVRVAQLEKMLGDKDDEMTKIVADLQTLAGVDVADLALCNEMQVAMTDWERLAAFLVPMIRGVEMPTGDMQERVDTWWQWHGDHYSGESKGFYVHWCREHLGDFSEFLRESFPMLNVNSFSTQVSEHNNKVC